MGPRSNGTVNSSGRKRSGGTLVLLTLVGAVLGILIVNKLREGRVLGLVLQDRDHELVVLRMILEREKGRSKEMIEKIDELKEKVIYLRTHKSQLRDRLTRAETLAAQLRTKQAELESTLQEKQGKLSAMEEDSIKINMELASLRELVQKQQQQADSGETVQQLQQQADAGDAEQQQQQQALAGETEEEEEEEEQQQASAGETEQQQQQQQQAPAGETEDEQQQQASASETEQQQQQQADGSETVQQLQQQAYAGEIEEHQKQAPAGEREQQPQQDHTMEREQQHQQASAGETEPWQKQRAPSGETEQQQQAYAGEIEEHQQQAPPGEMEMHQQQANAGEMEWQQAQKADSGKAEQEEPWIQSEHWTLPDDGSGEAVGKGDEVKDGGENESLERENSKRGTWLRLETNMDQAKDASEERIQEAELQLEGTAKDGELPTLKEKDEGSDAAAAKASVLQNGPAKLSSEDSEGRKRGRRSRRRRAKGRRRSSSGGGGNASPAQNAADSEDPHENHQTSLELGPEEPARTNGEGNAENTGGRPEGAETIGSTVRAEEGEKKVEGDGGDEGRTTQVEVSEMAEERKGGWGVLLPLRGYAAGADDGGFQRP